MNFVANTLYNQVDSSWIPQIEAGPGGAGKVQADQLVLSEQVGAPTWEETLFHHSCIFPVPRLTNPVYLACTPLSKEFSFW